MQFVQCVICEYICGSSGRLGDVGEVGVDGGGGVSIAGGEGGVGGLDGVIKVFDATRSKVLIRFDADGWTEFDGLSVAARLLPPFTGSASSMERRMQTHLYSWWTMHHWSSEAVALGRRVSETSQCRR